MVSLFYLTPCLTANPLFKMMFSIKIMVQKPQRLCNKINKISLYMLKNPVALNKNLTYFLYTLVE